MHIVWMVKDASSAPGHVYGLFAEEESAKDYVAQAVHLGDGKVKDFHILPYHVWYGQQSYPTQPIVSDAELEAEDLKRRLKVLNKQAKKKVSQARK